MRYKIRNWSKYQHYKDRNPPWIKLHFELLASEDWVTLSDASRVLAIASMLLASRNDGCVPADPKYLKRVAYLHELPDFTELLNCGFVTKEDDASNMLADASISVSVSDSSLEGGVGETLKSAAAMAERYWITTAGTHKSSLSDFTDHFKAKLDWLEANGKGWQIQHIMPCIESRDKSTANTVNKMFTFWNYFDEFLKDIPPPAKVYKKSAEQLKFEADLALAGRPGGKK